MVKFNVYTTNIIADLVVESSGDEYKNDCANYLIKAQFDYKEAARKSRITKIGDDYEQNERIHQEAKQHMYVAYAMYKVSR